MELNSWRRKNQARPHQRWNLDFKNADVSAIKFQRFKRKHESLLGSALDEHGY
jgi:hypothetical protein